MSTHDPASTQRVDALEAELARRAAALDHIHTITKTFVALSLNEREAICDTLIALICSFCAYERGLILICSRERHTPELAAVYDIREREPLLSDAARATWSALLDAREALRLDGEAVRARWPARPEIFAEGLAAVSVDIEDRPIGLIVVAGKRSGAAIDEADVELLAVLGGLAALFIANGDAAIAQRELLAELARAAEAARHEAAAKQRTLEQLDAQLLLVEQQRLAIRQLSTPILEIWERVLVLPLIGSLDARRSLDIMEHLLEAIVQRQAKYAIVDLTGVEHVDTETGNYLIKIINSARLLGARCVLTGIRPVVAQTLVMLGIDLPSVTTAATLRRGLDYCIRQLSGATADSTLKPVERQSRG